MLRPGRRGREGAERRQGPPAVRARPRAPRTTRPERRGRTPSSASATCGRGSASRSWATPTGCATRSTASAGSCPARSRSSAGRARPRPRVGGVAAARSRTALLGRRLLPLALAGLTAAASSRSCTSGCSGSRDGRAGRRASDAVTADGAQAATEAFAARTPPSRRGARVRLVDRGDARALGRRRELLPAHLRRRRSGALVGPHPHVRLAGGRGGDADGRPAGAQAVGGASRCG